MSALIVTDNPKPLIWRKVSPYANSRKKQASTTFCVLALQRGYVPLQSQSQSQKNKNGVLRKWKKVHHAKSSISVCLYSTKISRATIYNYIDSGVFLKLRRKHLLRGERKQRKEKVVKRPYKLHPDKKSIEVRPTDYMQRNHFGHWEMDTVIGQLKGKNNVLLVLSERKTRHEIIIKVKDKTAKSVTDAVAKLHKKYGNTFKQVFKSITVDNGVEFQDYKGIQEHVAELYYCHPYSSWERGTNENINAMIRRFIPKGKDMNKITHKEVQRIQDWINNYPRAIFHSTAQREFDKELQNLKFAQ